VLPRLDNTAGAIDIAARLREALERPIAIEASTSRSACRSAWPSRRCTATTA